jgi:hypothetical protein
VTSVFVYKFGGSSGTFARQLIQLRRYFRHASHNLRNSKISPHSGFERSPHRVLCKLFEFWIFQASEMWRRVVWYIHLPVYRNGLPFSSWGLSNSNVELCFFTESRRVEYNKQDYRNTAENSVCFWRDIPRQSSASLFTRFVDHTQRRMTLGRTPLYEWLARRRDHYLATQQISTHPVGFGPTISAGERPQTYALRWIHITLTWDHVTSDAVSRVGSLQLSAECSHCSDVT